MHIEGILSVNVFVEQTEQVRYFYEDGLVLPDGLVRDNLLTFFSGESVLNLVAASDTDRPNIGRQTGLAFRVRGEGDLQRYGDRIHSKFSSCMKGTVVNWRGGMWLQLVDPAGNEITLYEDNLNSSTPHMFDSPASVSVRVSDLRDALDFYYGVLQIPLADQPDSDSAVLFYEGTRLILTTGRNGSPTQPASGETGICLTVNDLHGLIGNIQHRRIPMEEELHTGKHQMGASVRDPFGNLITFLSHA
jgi:catechol 2,3-dioxygenase-like lactoylglutathione lyase family enzyme